VNAQNVFLGLPEAGWMAISAIVSAGVAIATVSLALYTRRLAVETRDLVKSSAAERAQVERHHQQTMMPLVLIQAACIWRTVKDRNTMVLRGTIRNVGAGSATSVLLYIRPIGGPPAHSYDYGAISPNSANEFTIGWDFAAPRDAGQGAEEANVPYDCFTTFESIFGTRGAVYQRSETGEDEPTAIGALVLPTGDSQREIDSLFRLHCPELPMAPR
jgi:hypothetical protein